MSEEMIANNPPVTVPPAPSTDRATVAILDGEVIRLNDALKKMEGELKEANVELCKLRDASCLLFGDAIEDIVEDRIEGAVTKERVVEVLQGTNPCDIYSFSDYSGEITEAVDINAIATDVAEAVASNIDIEYQVETAVDGYLSDYDPMEGIDVMDYISSDSVPDCWWEAISENLLAKDEFIQDIAARTAELTLGGDAYVRVHGYPKLGENDRGRVERMVRALSPGRNDRRKFHDLLDGFSRSAVDDDQDAAIEYHAVRIEAKRKRMRTLGNCAVCDCGGTVLKTVVCEACLATNEYGVSRLSSLVNRHHVEALA